METMFFPPRSTVLALTLFLTNQMGHLSTASDNEAPSAAGIEFFEKNVRSILIDHCYECHSGEEINGGLSIETRESLLLGGDSGQAIVPGDVNSSLLIRSIRYENPDLKMPPDGRLKDAEIATLEKWIALGAPDPREGLPTTSSNTGMSLEEGLEFWSFQPIKRPTVPSIQTEQWIQTPIDAFVLEKLEAKGLQPAPPADRRTLIRRLTYDLTGLPPTVDEIADFENDTSPTAYRRLVERLLASEQYGVRWGRHWLDVARYADSNGLDENLAFGNAWRYRDYVVDSFNQDKPVNQFIVEQLAGDLLPDANEATKTATGFLVLGAKVLAEPDREKLEMDTIDEQIDTTGKAVMGMTLGCVRCHDHKFDPISQRDYYALAAVFKSTKTFGDTNTGAIKHWNEHVFASEQELASIKKFDDLIAEKKKAATDFKNRAMSDLRNSARALATEYLVAATRIDLGMSLRQVEMVAKPMGLHPRILHHCRRHLEFHVDDPLFMPWHEMSGENHSDSVDRYYRPLFTQAQAANKPVEGETASEPAKESPLVTAARSELNNSSGFLTVPAKPEFAFDDATLAQYDRLMEEARITESNAPDVASAMGVRDGEILTSLPIHIRGSHRNLGEPVSRDVPAVMRPATSGIKFIDEQSGRLQLATWMTDAKHPLTARVYVNRLWRWHFGRGIVRTTENFGVLGEFPSHPELLDWLAAELIENNWSTKNLHRLIVLSSTYQQSSAASPGQDQNQLTDSDPDPENQFLSRFPMQRLEAEQIHDSILAVCGELDLRLGGKTVPLRNRQFVFNHTSVDHTKYDSPRRAIFLPVIRNNLFTTFEQFDFPDPTMPTGNRSSTIVAPQVLLMMNSEQVINASTALGHRLLDLSASNDSRVAIAFQEILGRQPTSEETRRSRQLINNLSVTSGLDSLSAWSMLCQSLIASNEFMYLR